MRSALKSSAIPFVGGIALAVQAMALIAASPEPSAAPTPAASPTATPVVVTIDKSGFHPTSIRVFVGESVGWMNADKTQHTATAADGSWDTGPIDPGQTVERTFYDPGRWEYVSGFNPSLRAILIVATPAPTGASPSARPVSLGPVAPAPLTGVAAPASATAAPTPDTGGGG